MSTASSSAFSLWATLSVLFLVFLVHHLWCYDRFQCLRWSAGRQPGAFKRVMTYSYLGAVPLLMVYSIGMTVIKVKEGYIMLDGTIVTTPINSYSPANRSWVLPLQFVFSFGWALEMVTHLEELAFWLYLLHQNPEKEAWFSSWEYRLWYIGSVAAIIGMPLTALITRRDLQTCDAYIFLVGSAGSTLTTLAFLHVLWRFPKFIRHVKTEGADPAVVVRLATFYQLNQVRVVFRFLFTIPLLIVALDGIIGTEHPVNRNLFVTDFLQILAGIGCFVSSMFTLLIFFPRSITRESGYKPKISSTAPNSPKSPDATPPSRPEPFPYDMAANIHMQHIPTHTMGYAMPGAIGMSATGGARYSIAGYTTGYTESAYTHSVNSPGESLPDSPQYVPCAPSSGEDGADMQRRGSRMSRSSRKLASRRASAYSGRPMDAHPEGDSDGEEYEGDDERRRDKGTERTRVMMREDEESAPPYSRSHPPLQPHTRPRGQPDQQTQTQAALLHQRQPFLRSDSSTPISSSPPPSATAQDPNFPPPSPSSPAPAYPPNIHATPTISSHSPPSPTSKAKRHTWDWEERRLTSLQGHGRRGSLHLIANGPGATAVNLGPGGTGVGLGLGVNLNLNLTTGGGGGSSGGNRNGRRRSALHPYVVNFTSPIDLVDLPPARDELPRAI